MADGFCSNGGRESCDSSPLWKGQCYNYTAEWKSGDPELEPAPLISQLEESFVLKWKLLFLMT